MDAIFGYKILVHFHTKVYIQSHLWTEMHNKSCVGVCAKKDFPPRRVDQDFHLEGMNQLFGEMIQFLGVDQECVIEM